MAAQASRRDHHYDQPAVDHALRRIRMSEDADGGFSMIVTMLSLVIGALLVALLLGKTLGSSTTSSTSITNAPGVAEADGLQAKQSLSIGLTAAAAAAAAASGGYATLTSTDLSQANPSIHFVAGPSAGASTVSVATTAGGGGGSITMAAHASDGTCWLVWKPDQGATWYGAQSDLASCTAPAISSPPTPDPVSSSTIGWQQGSFPSP
jgi:hypothetical protein